MHDHGHGHAHLPPSDAGSSRMGVAFLLNLTFTIIELVGGFWTGSAAILADAVHDLGDTFALGLAWLLERVAGKGGDDRFPYGYRRWSMLGALLTGLLLIAGSLLIIYGAALRLREVPEMPNTLGMIGLAIVGILFNGAAVFRLEGGATHNEAMVRWHLLEDVLGWVAVLVTAIVMHFFQIAILDSLLAIGIALWVLWNAGRAFWSTLVTLLQGTPPGYDLGALERALAEVDGVCGVHHMHVWSLDGARHVLTAHVQSEASLDGAGRAALREAVKHEAAHFQVVHATIEIEGPDEPCVDDGAHGEA